MGWINLFKQQFIRSTTDLKTPELLGAFSPEAKLAKAEEIYKGYYVTFMPHELENVCQHDFKLCSLVVHKLVIARYLQDTKIEFNDLPTFWGPFAPVRYCGGNMVFGRVFSINTCSFPSDETIIGLRINNTPFKILKGMEYVEQREDWTIFRISRRLTDDMNAMIYLPLEKNFTIEFAHFISDRELRIIFRMIDC